MQNRLVSDSNERTNQPKEWQSQCRVWCPEVELQPLVQPPRPLSQFVFAFQRAAPTTTRLAARSPLCSSSPVALGDFSKIYRDPLTQSSRTIRLFNERLKLLVQCSLRKKHLPATVSLIRSVLLYHLTRDGTRIVSPHSCSTHPDRR